MFDALARRHSGMKLIELSQLLGAPTSSLLNLQRPLYSTATFRSRTCIIDWGPRRSAFRPASCQAGISQTDCTLSCWNSRGQRANRCTSVSWTPRANRLSTSTQSIARDPYATARPSAVHDPCIQPPEAGCCSRLRSHSLQQPICRNLQSSDPARWTAKARRLIQDELVEIRTANYSMNLEEAAYEFGSVAAPIFGVSGDCVASIAVSAPVSELNRRLKELRGLVTNVAQRASAPARDRPDHDAAPRISARVRGPMTA